jgi:hypothetical protein
LPSSVRDREAREIPYARQVAAVAKALGLVCCRGNVTSWRWRSSGTASGPDTGPDAFTDPLAKARYLAEISEGGRDPSPQAGIDARDAQIAAERRADTAEHQKNVVVEYGKDQGTF